MSRDPLYLATGIRKEEPAIQAGEGFRAIATSCQARRNLQLHHFSSISGWYQSQARNDLSGQSITKHEGEKQCFNIQSDQKTMASDSSLLSEEGKQISTSAPPTAPNQHWLERWWRVVKRYPILFGVVTLMLASLVFWLAGRGDIANYILLAVALLGGIPLLWETLKQLFHKEFGVDVIAILAIGGSILLGQYLAGALVVLMLSGGEALEAYALRRARSSLSALAERAPRSAHIWRVRN